MKPLVGDEIQHCKINIGRGWDKSSGSVTLLTYVMDLFLGIISHIFLPVRVPTKESE
jgi:hypothetical protein